MCVFVQCSVMFLHMSFIVKYTETQLNKMITVACIIFTERGSQPNNKAIFNNTSFHIRCAIAVES